MSLSVTTRATRVMTSRSLPRVSARVVRVRAVVPDESTDYKNTGYVSVDNSGKGNMYPITQKPTFDAPKVAGEGLGGSQGGLLLAGVIVAVFGATFIISAGGPKETVTSLSYAGESLSSIAAAISASL